MSLAARLNTDRELLFGLLESWIRWRYGEVRGTAFVAVSAPKQLPSAVGRWAMKHRDAVWQLIWFESNAVLCGLAPMDPYTDADQFAVVQHTSRGVTTEAVFACMDDGSWRHLP
jgi:hypothetical protein